jgi:uncharacterized secreted protein with C-terminal beta-propeller domain
MIIGFAFENISVNDILIFDERTNVVHKITKREMEDSEFQAEFQAARNKANKAKYILHPDHIEFGIAE